MIKINGLQVGKSAWAIFWNLDARVEHCFRQFFARLLCLWSQGGIFLTLFFTESDFPSQQLSTANRSSEWGGAWRSSHPSALGFFSALLLSGQPQVLWAHECDSYGVSRRQHFMRLLPIFWFLDSSHLFCSVPPALMVVGLIKMPRVGLGLLLLMFWSIVHLFIDCCPWQEEASLTKTESSPGPWLEA